jgi:hypothetical protein
VVVIDINEDNNEDIIIGTNREHLKIFLNRGNDELTDETIHPTNAPMNYIVKGDMNNDGKLDLIGINKYVTGGNIIYNSGNGL